VEIFMKTSRNSDSQILSIVKQAENGIAVPVFAANMGIGASL